MQVVFVLKLNMYVQNVSKRDIMPVLANLCKTYLYYTLYVIYIQYVNKGHIMPTLIIQCVILCKIIYLFVHYINIFKSDDNTCTR